MSTLDPAAEFDYSPRVRELFVDLQHAGALPDASGVATAGLAEQGATITLKIKVRAAAIEAVRYHAYGCPYFLAGCELLARVLEGQPVNVLNDWDGRRLENELQAPPGKRARWLLLEDAVRQMAMKLR